MELRYHSYYCYLKQGKAVVEEREPEDFTNLPFHYRTYCPNTEIAKMIYGAELKIMEWRI